MNAEWRRVLNTGECSQIVELSFKADSVFTVKVILIGTVRSIFVLLVFGVILLSPDFD